jgi:hypothetical protein
MNAKSMLQALNERFPISAETCGKDFHGAHSITLNAQGQVQLNVWVMTPVGLRVFPTTVAEDEMVGEPRALALEIEKAVRAWAQANPKGEKVAITLNGEAVTLDSTELTYEKVVQLSHPDATTVVYSVTYHYRGKGGGGFLHPGEKVTAVHGMIVNCVYTGNA